MSVGFVLLAQLFGPWEDSGALTFVANRLRMLRAEREWSQAKLAEHLEVSRLTVNAIETGKYDPSLPLAFRIARVFGQAIEAIFDDGLGRRQERGR